MQGKNKNGFSLLEIIAHVPNIYCLKVKYLGMSSQLEKLAATPQHSGKLNRIGHILYLEPTEAKRAYWKNYGEEQTY